MRHLNISTTVTPSINMPNLLIDMAKQFILAALTAIFLIGGARAIHSQPLTFKSSGTPPTLVELYTSQGCSSCPPAERFVSRYANDPRLFKDLFILAFHVDYWDYIGWKDIFSAPQYTQRQYNYFRRKAIDRVYTPGFIINGAEWRGFFRGKQLPNASSKAARNSSHGQLTTTVTKTTLNATFKPAGKTGETYILNVAIVGFGVVTNIQAGENMGRSLNQDFVVLGFDQQLPTTQKKATVHAWRLQVPHYATHGAQKIGIITWISTRTDPTPIQAAGGWI